LVGEAEFVHATLSRRQVVCGKASCKCARGEKHEALYLVARRAGRSEQLFVPKSLAGQAERWVKQYHHALTQLEKLCGIYWEKLRRRDA
jgi:hypothetical protein